MRTHCVDLTGGFYKVFITTKDFDTWYLVIPWDRKLTHYEILGLFEGRRKEFQKSVVE